MVEIGTSANSENGIGKISHKTSTIAVWLRFLVYAYDSSGYACPASFFISLLGISCSFMFGYMKKTMNAIAVQVSLKVSRQNQPMYTVCAVFPYAWQYTETRFVQKRKARAPLIVEINPYYTFLLLWTHWINCICQTAMKCCVRSGPQRCLTLKSTGERWK